jgi:hypothetical protein
MLWHVSFMSMARGEHCTPRALPMSLKPRFAAREPRAPWLWVLSTAMDERGPDPCEVAFEFLL